MPSFPMLMPIEPQLWWVKVSSIKIIYIAVDISKESLVFMVLVRNLNTNRPT